VVLLVALPEVVLVSVALVSVALVLVVLVLVLAYNQLSLLLPALLPRKQQSLISVVLFFSPKTSSKISILNTSNVIHFIIGTPSLYNLSL